MALIDKSEPRTITVSEGNYTISQIYKLINESDHESVEKALRKKHFYKIVVDGFTISVRVRFTSFLPDACDIEISKFQSDGSHDPSFFYYSSMWHRIPSEVLYQVISIKNLLKDWVNDKIEWPFEPCEPPPNFY